MQPTYKITVNGKDITPKVSGRLVMLTLTDEAGVKSDRVEIVLDDRDQLLEIPPTKSDIGVQIGYTDLVVDKGTYVVEEVQVGGPVRTMTIRANATGASRGAGAARERSWHDTTLGGIAASIARQRGWTLAISDDLAAIEVPHVDQHENDLQFLSRLAGDNEAVAKVAHGNLVIAPHGEAKTVAGQSLPVVIVNANQVAEWEALIAERGNYDGVRAQYHDIKTGQRGEAIAGQDTDNTHSLPHTYSTKAAADRAAKSKLKSVKRGKSTFAITSMVGNPMLEAESRLRAQGFRTGVDGDWNIVTVRHMLTDQNYTCSVECENKDAA